VETLLRTVGDELDADTEELLMGVLRVLRSRQPGHVAAGEGAELDELAVLLAEAGRGDEASFVALYDEVIGLVHGLVLKVVRDPAQTEEVVQEVFVELWRLAPRYDSTKGSVKSWVATLAHRRAVDRVRSERAARARTECDASRVIAEHDSVADAVIGSADAEFDRARVRRSLDRLTMLQREAVELAYFGGHTYREVAVLLDIAEGTVKTRIRDGLIRLRDELGAMHE
jgi:RNA polymerase sigma-70 factor (ECF subfamily)